MISTIVFLQLRKTLLGPGISTRTLIENTQSLICMKKRDGTVIVKVPNKQVKKFYHDLKVKIPSFIDLEKYRSETLGLDTKKS